MPEEPPTSERAAVYYIAAIIKNYEPEFELRKNFTPGLFGRSDPRYPTVRREWLHGLVRNGDLEKRLLSLAEASDDLVDHHSDEADSRLNWRITFQHAFYLIHIMALDKTFQRFALSVQTKSDFKEGLISIRKRPPYLRYEVVSRLSELKPILANIWESFRREEEESHQQGRIDVAVAREREKWLKRLADERKRRQQIGYLVAFVAIVVVSIALNEHLHWWGYGLTQFDFFAVLFGRPA